MSAVVRRDRSWTIYLSLEFEIYAKGSMSAVVLFCHGGKGKKGSPRAPDRPGACPSRKIDEQDTTDNCEKEKD